MTKFLYLTERDWSIPWIEGGQIPLRLASWYRADVRDGTKTKDECSTQVGVNLSGADAEHIRSIFIGATGGLNARFVKLPGGRMLDAVQLHYSPWDGRILSLSNAESRTICERLGKTCCVAIDDVAGLFETISRGLGATGNHRACVYTDGAMRDQFTKSTADAWQDEYRMYWEGAPGGAPVVQVGIPAGTARWLWYL